MNQARPRSRRAVAPRVPSVLALAVLAACTCPRTGIKPTSHTNGDDEDAPVAKVVRDINQVPPAGTTGQTEQDKNQGSTPTLLRSGGGNRAFLFAKGSHGKQSPAWRAYRYDGVSILEASGWSSDERPTLAVVEGTGPEAVCWFVAPEARKRLMRVDRDGVHTGDEKAGSVLAFAAAGSHRFVVLHEDSETSIVPLPAETLDDATKIELPDIVSAELADCGHGDRPFLAGRFQTKAGTQDSQLQFHVVVFADYSTPGTAKVAGPYAEATPVVTDRAGFAWYAASSKQSQQLFFSAGNEPRPVSGPGSGAMSHLCPLGDRLYFARNGSEIWTVKNTLEAGRIALPDGLEVMEVLGIATQPSATPGRSAFLLAQEPQTGRLHVCRLEGTSATHLASVEADKAQDTHFCALADAIVFFARSDNAVRVFHYDFNSRILRRRPEAMVGDPVPECLALMTRMLFTAEVKDKGIEPYHFPLPP